LLDQKGECRKILKSEDWSPTSPDFRVSAAALNEDWDEAISVMKEIGAQGSVGSAEYRNWPVFSSLRERAEFKAAYEGIFGESFDEVSQKIEEPA
jgi:hypothetical protein